MSDLNVQLLQAHAAGDAREISALYEKAAAMAQDEIATAFFLTHAYVHALEAGLPSAHRLRQRLVAMGREVPNI